MAWISYQDGLPLRHCCATGDANATMTLSTSWQLYQIPITTYGVCSDSSLYSISENGIRVSEAGLYLISASVYFLPGQAGDTRGVYIYNDPGKELASVQYYGSGTTNTGALGISPKIVALSAGTVLRLFCRSGFVGNAPKVYNGNLGTYLTVIKVG